MREVSCPKINGGDEIRKLKMLGISS